MSATIQLASDLISQRSVTPDDANCQQLLAERLAACGFTNRHLPYGEVNNLWSTLGEKGPLFVFAGHTDVVPPGDEQSWQYPPFAGTVDKGYLHGRGAADMKSSIAAMVVACERLLQTRAGKLRGRIGFLITSDEEGPAINGTRKVIDYLSDSGCQIDYCLVGEPTSTTTLGDTVKVGRRGSLNGHLIVHGQQGHVAYAHLADNPIHRTGQLLTRLSEQQWDEGNAHFPPTSFQISNIHSGTGAENVIPATLEMKFNFRFSTEVTAEQLQQWVEKLLDSSGSKYELNWRLSGSPFLTAHGELVSVASAAIENITGRATELSTSGGTSDGRFIAPTGAQVIELGPINATIHQIDECVCCADLDQLTEIYLEILKQLV